ncbi:adenylate/guanylate cyclase domain-containing protein [Nocardioides humilatus]|uniref:Adenylate/guanylate cyclase domain-containing protein n=1 Tax=Nocardioides humilatus TaxID=2607660 RepID=A0A5B1LG50_9ACTN|nr:adenylate/guanylate cyclase domain-containing protein [Nocardioides humilatus]KAA1419334.1 adenylate/guanylate cyclase domain-containing protein [Nocardioides humilatus]
MTRANTMSILFTDLVGSTAMGDRLGDDDAETVRRRFFAIIEEAVEPTGGRIVKTLGDGHMVVFASALDAVGCGIAIQAAVDAHNSEPDAEHIGVRVGINAGDVSVEGEDYFGTPVTIAKRLCDSADGGQILISGLVESLVGTRGGFAFRHVAPLELRGLSRPQAASEVLWRNPETAFTTASTKAARPTTAAGQPRRWGRRRSAVAAVVGLVTAGAIIAAVASKDEDQEPEDKPNPAAPYSGKVLIDVTGTVPSSDRRRVHTFEAYAGDVVHLDLWSRAPGVYLVLELRTESGRLLAFDEGAGDPGISAFELTRNGQYQAVARMFRPAENGPYELRVVRSDGPAAEALGVGYDEFVKPGQTYLQQVRLRKGRSTRVEVLSESVNRADLVLELVDSAGVVVASDDGSGELGDPSIKRFRPAATGSYTVRVRAKTPRDLGAFRVAVITN